MKKRVIPTRLLLDIKTKTKTVTPQKATQINLYSGYTFQQGLHRELLCMKLLYSAYLKFGCTCGRNKPHFPVMVSNKIKSGGHIKMTYQGIDLQKMKRKKYLLVDSLSGLKTLNGLLDASIPRQIDCILNILYKANIVHLDLNDNGKNICINEAGHLSIIDFDIMYLKSVDSNKTLTPLMHKRINRFKRVDFKKKIYNIIQMVV